MASYEHGYALERQYVVLSRAEKQGSEGAPVMCLLEGLVQHFAAADVLALEEFRCNDEPSGNRVLRPGDTIDKVG